MGWSSFSSTGTVAAMIAVNALGSSGIEDREELIALSEEARDYLLAHKWCSEIRNAWFDRGFAKVAVFCFEFVTNRGKIDRCWTIVGDVPPAHIDCELCPNGAAALSGYVGEMSAWVDAAKANESTKDLIPVRRRGSFELIAPSDQFIRMLEGRLSFIAEELLPQWADEANEGL